MLQVNIKASIAKESSKYVDKVFTVTDKKMIELSMQVKEIAQR